MDCSLSDLLLSKRLSSDHFWSDCSSVNSQTCHYSIFMSLKGFSVLLISYPWLVNIDHCVLWERIWQSMHCSTYYVHTCRTTTCNLLYKGLIFLMDHLYVFTYLHYMCSTCFILLLYFYRNFWRKKKKVSAYLLTQQNLLTTASIWPAKPTIKRSTTIMLRTLYLSLCTVSRTPLRQRYQMCIWYAKQ